MDKDSGQIGSGSAMTGAPKGGMSPAAVVGSLILVAALAGGGVWYALKVAAPAPVPIATVLGDLRKYDGQFVTVKGHVSQAMNLPIVDVKFFELSDDSGTITVVTEKGLPGDGEEVMVKGMVKQAFKVGRFEKTVLYEPAEEEK